MCDWLNLMGSNEVLFLTYEFMKLNSLLFFSAIFKYLDIKISEEVLQGAREKRNFVTMAKRDVGVEDVKNHFRKGIIGSWKNYFKPHHVELFFSQPRYKELYEGFSYDNPNA